MFLDVLMFILWLLLFIVGFVLLIVLTVLFVPIKYKVYVVNSPDTVANCRISLLFGAIKFLVHYDNAKESSDFVLKIFGISLGDMLSKKSRKPIRYKSQRKKSKTTAPSYPEKMPEKVVVKPEPQPEKHSENINEDNNKNKEKQTESRKKNKEKKQGFYKSIKEKIEGIKEKIKDIKSGYNRIKAIPHKKEIFKALLKLLKRIFAVFKPKHFSANIEFGLDEPATTAELLGAIEIIKAFTGIKIETIADYNNKVFRYKVSAQGGFMVFFLILPIVKFILTPPVLHVIRNYKTI